MGPARLAGGAFAMVCGAERREAPVADEHGVRLPRERFVNVTPGGAGRRDSFSP